MGVGMNFGLLCRAVNVDVNVLWMAVGMYFGLLCMAVGMYFGLQCMAVGTHLAFLLHDCDTDLGLFCMAVMDDLAVVPGCWHSEHYGKVV